MDKRRVLVNAMMAVIQIVVVSGVLFILYRFLLRTIGVKQLGIWSLVLATTSVTQVASFGLSGSVVKFVAKYIARNEYENVSAVIQTAVLSVAMFVGGIALIGYPIARWLLGFFISPESLPLALAILPLAFLSLWLTVIASVFQSGLDGYQRYDIRSIMFIGAAIIHLFLCFLLAPHWGLIGLAYAQIIQASVLIIGLWLCLKRQIGILPVIPRTWNRKLFKEMINYGVNFQIISVTGMLYDPMTKALLSKFGGLSIVGYYEMASRMLQQFRALLVSANQVLVPAIADLQEKIPGKIKSVYLESYRLLFFLSLPLYSLIIVCAPAISELWIGHDERLFVLLTVLLSAGWLLNTLNVPAYFSNLGIGELRWNVVSHIAIAALNAILGVFLGLAYDGIGVAVGWVISLGLGSSIVYLSYHLKHKIPLLELLPKASRGLVLACFGGIFTALLIHYKFYSSFNKIELNGLMVLSFLIITIIPVLLHPLRRRLRGWIGQYIINSRRAT